MNIITQIPLSLEVISIITAYLRPHHLAAYDWDGDEDSCWYRSTLAPERWFNYTRSKVENAALEKYGRLVRKVKCETYNDIVLFATHAHTCTGLQELVIRSPLNNPFSSLLDLDLELVMTIFQHIVGFQTHRIHGSILSECNTDLVRMVDAIPLAVERLELCSWDPISGQREYSWSQGQEQETVDIIEMTSRNLKRQLSQHHYFDLHISP